MSTTQEETQRSTEPSDPEEPQSPSVIDAQLISRVIAALGFVALGGMLFHAAPTLAVGYVCAVLLLTVYMFVFEIVSVDVTAIAIMVLLGLTTPLAPYLGLDAGLVDNREILLALAPTR